jgi:hypothetical protein
VADCPYDLHTLVDLEILEMFPVHLGICLEMITTTAGLTPGAFGSSHPYAANFFQVVEHPWTGPQAIKDHWLLADVSYILGRKVASHL